MLGRKRRSGGVLERLGGVLGRPEILLGRFGSVLKASWAVLGPSWGRLRSSWGHLGGVLGCLGGLLGRQVGVLGASWGHLVLDFIPKAPKSSDTILDAIFQWRFIRFGLRNSMPEHWKIIKLYRKNNSCLLSGYFNIRSFSDAICIPTLLHIVGKITPKSRLGGIMGRSWTLFEAS